MDENKNIRLDYAPAKPRPGWRLKLAVALIAVVALIVGARWIKSSWPGWERRYYIYRCLHFEGPPGSAAVGQPDCWFRISGQARGDPDTTVFLHERTAHNGVKRLVWVQAFPSSSEQDEDTKSHGGNPDPGWFLYFELSTYDPATLYKSADRIATYRGNPQTDWVIGQGRQLTLLNGKADLVDISHFTLVYDLDGARHDRRLAAG